MVEYRGGRYEVDAIETSAAEMESLHREKLLIEVKSSHIADIVPAALRPHREWVGDRLNIISAGYNTNLVRKQDAPKSYEDLLDPKWKGKLGIEADDAVWFGALANAMGEQKALKLFRDLVRTNGLSVRKGHTLLANLVISGEVPFSLTLYHYKAEQLKNAGAPIDWYVLPPGFARFLGTGILRRPPHPHGAALVVPRRSGTQGRQIVDVASLALGPGSRCAPPGTRGCSPGHEPVTYDLNARTAFLNSVPGSRCAGLLPHSRRCSRSSSR